MVDYAKEYGIVQIELPTPFPVGGANVFLVKRDPPILIDAGLRTGETYGLLCDALNEEGYAVGDLGAVILTHGHRDHVGLLGHILQDSNAKAYGHPDVKKEGEDKQDENTLRKQFYVDIMGELGVPEDVQEEVNSDYDRFRSFSEPYTIHHVVEDEETVLGYRAYFVPGHSSSDTLFVDEERGLTFVGDHILTGTNPNPLLRRAVGGEPRAKSLVEYRASLQRTRTLELGICFPGHGKPFENHVEVVDLILAKQDQRSQQIMSVIRDGDTTPYRVARRLFPDLAMRHLHLGLSIAVGHMEVLEEDGTLRFEPENGILNYLPVA